MSKNLFFISSVWACQDLLETHRTDAKFLEAYKGNSKFDLDCLDSLVKLNYFESAKYMLS